MSSVRVSICVCRLHVCVFYVVLLGQFRGSCEWDVSAHVAFCFMLLWGIICMRDVLPVFPPYRVGKPALLPKLVPPLSAVCEVGMGYVLCGCC